LCLQKFFEDKRNVYILRLVITAIYYLNFLFHNSTKNKIKNLLTFLCVFDIVKEIFNRGAEMPCGKKRKRQKIATHKRKKKLRRNRHKNK